ncbi:elongation factor P [bacterium]|nr:elongation factor P [bacterium]
MATTADFKKGFRILVDGQPWALVEHTIQSPSARGGQTLVKAKLRNLIDGSFMEKVWKAGESFDEPDLTFRVASYLYSDSEDAYFMDTESYEQFQLPLEKLGDMVPWLTENMEVRAIHFGGEVANIELPKVVVVEVLETEPTVRGNTASGKVLKRAVVAGGVEIQVPLYLETGEKIEVDPLERRFIRRA